MSEFICEYCDIKFDNIDGLNHHITHSHYACILCKTKEKPIYESALQLQKHRKAKHPLYFIDEDWNYDYE